MKKVTSLCCLLCFILCQCYPGWWSTVNTCYTVHTIQYRMDTINICTSLTTAVFFCKVISAMCLHLYRRGILSVQKLFALTLFLFLCFLTGSFQLLCQARSRYINPKLKYCSFCPFVFFRIYVVGV